MVTSKIKGQRLNGKVAVVVGAGKGIGRAIARLLASEGAKLSVVSLHDESGEKTVNEIRSAGGFATFVRGDVSKLTDMLHMAEMTKDMFGRIDILCQNVGIYPSRFLEDMTEEDWDGVLSVNLKGTFFAVKVCLPYMKEQRYGKIAITSSITGPRTGVPGLSHYGASKAGIGGFIRNAALELARYNININAVEAGWTMTEGIRKELKNEEIRGISESIPLRRFADPEDIAHAVLFLVSDEARHMTGQAMVVDGGQTIVESKLSIT